MSQHQFENVGAAPDGTVQVKAATAITSTAISTDGSTAMLLFKLEGDETIALTIPVGDMAAVRGILGDLIARAEKQSLQVGKVVPKSPKNMGVGQSVDCRGRVILFFDRGLATEEVFLIPDMDALPIAEAIKQDVLRRAALAGSLHSGGRRLILGNG